MKEKQIFGLLFVMGMLIALIGATLMCFGIAPVSLRVTIVILGTGLIASSNAISRSKNI